VTRIATARAAKETGRQLREARSILRTLDRLVYDTSSGEPPPSSARLARDALERLVNHLVPQEHTLQAHANDALRRSRLTSRTSGTP
jgi:hypothetical protein